MIKIWQKIWGYNKIKPKTEEEMNKYREYIEKDRAMRESSKPTYNTNITKFDLKEIMYGNGATRPATSNVDRRMYMYRNGSSTSSGSSNNNYLSQNNNSTVTNGPTDVIGNNTITPSEPEVIIPDTTFSNSERTGGQNTTTPTNPEPVSPGPESIVEESSPNDYYNTGAETGNDTSSIIEDISVNPIEPISDYSESDINNDMYDSNNSNSGGISLPNNYMDGYADYHLTPSLGRIQYNGHDETYYNLDMSGVIDIMRNNGFTEFEYPYSVREDGVKTLGGYIMVAADLDIHPRGSIIDTSLGKAIVCDTGTFTYSNAEQIDIAVTW